MELGSARRIAELGSGLTLLHKRAECRNVRPDPVFRVSLVEAKRFLLSEFPITKASLIQPDDSAYSIQ